MEKIHESEFINIFYDKEKSFFEFKFNDLSEMEDDTFKKELETQAELTEKYNPERFLFHSKNFNFAITPEVQEWTDKNIFPRYINAGVKKFAYIFSSDMISQLSIEQVMDENEASKGFQTKYFDNEKEAKEWLFD